MASPPEWGGIDSARIWARTHARTTPPKLRAWMEMRAIARGAHFVQLRIVMRCRQALCCAREPDLLRVSGVADKAANRRRRRWKSVGNAAVHGNYGIVPDFPTPERGAPRTPFGGRLDRTRSTPRIDGSDLFVQLTVKHILNE